MSTSLPPLEHLEPQEANRLAQEVLFLHSQLAQRMQPVFASWVRAQTQGQLQDCNQAELASWLGSLNRGQAQAQHSLMVMEISWLEYLSREFIPPAQEEIE